MTGVVWLKRETFDDLRKRSPEGVQFPAVGELPLDLSLPQTLIHVKNTTGQSLPPQSILQVVDVIENDSKTKTQTRNWFEGETPDASGLGKYCVTLEPAADQQVVPAVISGSCLARRHLASDSANVLANGIEATNVARIEINGKDATFAFATDAGPPAAIIDGICLSHFGASFVLAKVRINPWSAWSTGSITRHLAVRVESFRRTDNGKYVYDVTPVDVHGDGEVVQSVEHPIGILRNDSEVATPIGSQMRYPISVGSVVVAETTGRPGVYKCAIEKQNRGERQLGNGG